MEKNIITGPSITRSIRGSLGELLIYKLKESGDEIIQIDANTGQKLSAHVLLDRAIILSKWLLKTNMKKGNCISIICENRFEFSVITVASLVSGITLAPLNPEYTHGELQHLMNLSKPKMIFCTPEIAEKIRARRSDYPYIEVFILFGNDYSKYQDVIMYEEIIKEAQRSPVDRNFQATPVNPDEDVAVILCSSGTTGMPKGVMLTHSNFTFNLEIRRYAEERNLKNNKRNNNRITTGLAPFCLGMGFTILLSNLTRNFQLVFYSRFLPTQFLESISKYRINELLVTPSTVLFLAKYPLINNYDLSSLKHLRSGSAPANKLEKEVGKKLNLDSTHQVYGMTETTVGVITSTGFEQKGGSVGKIIPGMMCKVVDEKGNALGPYQEGELCFKGPLVMKGYVNDPKTTADTIDKDNWLHTGDVGYYDSEEYFFIVDRIKELIKYKGFQIAPAELEALLQKHPAVLDAAVVGAEDEQAGELPTAFVVRKPNYMVTSEELQNYIASQISSPKHLRGGVHFINEVPRNASGKILRRILRKQAKALQSKL